MSTSRLRALAPHGRILVKEVNWLGDVVMSLPALRALRDAYPEARLAILVKQELASFFDGARWLDEVIPYRVARGFAGLSDRWRIVRAIRARRVDVAILFPRSFEAALWPTLAGVPRRAGFGTDGRSWMLTHTARWIGVQPDRHQAHDYLDLLGQLFGIDRSIIAAVPDVHEPHRTAMREWLAQHRRRPHGPLIALAAAAAYGPAKEWPTTHYAALIDHLAERHDAECVLVGAPNERAKCESVVAASRHGALVAAGATGVGQLIALLSLSSAFAGNDSGAMHVAAALRLPTVAIFGSTNPERTRPLGPQTSVLYHRIECSPCLQRTCRFGHYDCLRRIAVNEVAEALATLGAFR